jgi:MFS family permease
VIALLGLKELSPQLRDQLMVSLRDRALIEMRAKGLDIEKALQNHWRQLMRPDIIISSVAVSVMLLMYYALVGFLVIYATSTFGYTLNTANNLGYYAWSFNAGAVIMVGWLSDRFRVRKPFMVVGGIGAAVLIVLFLEQSKVGAHPKFSTIAILLAVMLFFMGVAYTPWMASFTETVEDRNPAAIAAGLAVWGWIIRVIIFASFIFLPIVIKSVTPIVNYGTAIQTDLNNYPPLQWAKTHPTIVALGQKYGALGAEAQKLGPEIAFAQKYPAVVADLQKYTPTTIPSKLLDTAIKDAGGGTKGLTVLTTLGAESATLLQIKAHQAQLLQMQPYSSELLALQNKVPANVSSFVATFGPQVQAALLTAPNQWRNWFWVCFGGVIFFVLSIPLLRGRWRPRDAKRDEQEHEAMVQAELAKLSGASYS